MALTIQDIENISHRNYSSSFFHEYPTPRMGIYTVLQSYTTWVLTILTVHDKSTPCLWFLPFMEAVKPFHLELFVIHFSDNFCENDCKWWMRWTVTAGDRVSKGWRMWWVWDGVHEKAVCSTLTLILSREKPQKRAPTSFKWRFQNF
jgi:hypothetical protein